MSTVKAAWESYERQCLPPEASQVQRTATEVAFYAGAAAMFSLITRASAANEAEMSAVLDALTLELFHHVEAALAAAEAEPPRTH